MPTGHVEDPHNNQEKDYGIFIGEDGHFYMYLKDDVNRHFTHGTIITYSENPEIKDHHGKKIEIYPPVRMDEEQYELMSAKRPLILKLNDEVKKYQNENTQN
jgi:hypothetical protein